MSAAVFCDSSGLYALVEPNSAQHESAASAWQSLLDGERRLVTSNYIVVELLALVQSRFGLALARELLDRIVEHVEVSWVDPVIHEAALAELFSRNRRRLSFVDCTSFALMRRHRIDTAFAFDAHFAEAGFQLYRAAQV